MTEPYQRGVAYHEAGHAVVLWSFGITVKAVRVCYNDAKGWNGGTDIDVGAADHLPLFERLAALAAGYTAENIFECYARQAAGDDHGKICMLLKGEGISEQEHPARIAEANSRARIRLEVYASSVVKLAERLVQHGSVGASEFLQLIHG